MHDEPMIYNSFQGGNMIIQETYQLANGVRIPKVGFGTWQIPNGQSAYDAVTKALQAGYRHIDSAANYKNEPSVGQAIKDFGLNRDDVFITTKLESFIKSYDETLRAFEQSRRALGVDYIDLYLIHAPWPWSEIGKDCSSGNVEAYKAMERLYNEGKIKAIGVSNFNVADLQNIMTHCEIVPMVNQISYFVGHVQEEVVAFCHANDILVEAYSPLAIGHLLTNDTLIAMAKRYNVSPAQVAIRYCLEKNTLPLPKSVNDARILENTKLDFMLLPRDVAILDAVKGDPRRWN
jgi:diketogulonate reductase-like aldo/keto reductase